MTDFSERFDSERQARETAERAKLRAALEQERDMIEAAEAMYRELTPAFAERASEIGWPPCTVVVSEVKQRKVSTGWFSSRTMEEKVYGHTLGEGWIIKDRVADARSSTGGTNNAFLVMMDGDWVALDETAWHLLKDDALFPGLPTEYYSAEIVVLDPSVRGIVPYRPHPATSQAADRMIDELLIAERDLR